MKKFKLDLSEYEVTSLQPDMESEKHEMKEVTQPYPLRANLNAWLRGIGVFRSGEDIAEAVSIAKQIRDCKEDSIELDEREANILKQAVNRLVEATADGKANLGGEIHEEAIIRVVKMQEVK
jgi:hypothetical protein